jgi:hypothetical protein
MTTQLHELLDAHIGDDKPLSRYQYVDTVLGLYRNAPGTLGHVRPSDRRLAGRLFADGVPLDMVRVALILAAVRRGFRPPDALPLEPIRSLSYFRPMIDEIIRRPIDPHYLEHLQRKLAELDDLKAAPTD